MAEHSEVHPANIFCGIEFCFLNVKTCLQRDEDLGEWLLPNVR